MDKTLEGAAAEFRRYLKHSYTTSADADVLDAMNLDELIFAACVLDDRSIHVHPRRVVLSPELQSRKLSQDISRVLSQVIKDCEAGRDLNPRLNNLPKLKAERSRDKLKKVSDQLLVQHGIHHLHLGGKRKLRANDLLFACFGRGIAYFLDVAKHDFSPQRYLDIVLRDFPKISGHEEIAGIDDVTSLPSRKDLNNSLYQTPLNYIHDHESEFYVQFGRGGSHSGTSRHARRRADAILEFCEDIAALNKGDEVHRFKTNVTDFYQSGRNYHLGFDEKGQLSCYDLSEKTYYPSGFEFTV